MNNRQDVLLLVIPLVSAVAERALCKRAFPEYAMFPMQFRGHNAELLRSSGFGLLGFLAFLSWAFRATLLRQEVSRKLLAYLSDELGVAQRPTGALTLTDQRG